jgi:menaquinone-specific isochorismate synthase
MKKIFFSCDCYPKFYLKTKTHELFALGKKEEPGSFLVGALPFHTTDFKGFYSPEEYELNTSLEVDSSSDFKQVAPISQDHSLSFSTWDNQVEKVKESIRSGLIQKLVLSRQTTFRFKEEINVEQFFKTFQRQNPSVAHFFYQEKARHAFFGGTPETLFFREGSNLTTESVAGTIKMEADCNFLSDEKFLEEFNIVKDQLVKILTPFAQTLEASKTGIKEFKHLKHLHATIFAQLKQTNDLEILKALHPTAALLGFPKRASFNLLKSIETQPRSLYGGPLGFLSESLSHILVGIRSGFIEEKTLNAFTGVGIVKTSNSLDEWKELNLKLQPISIWKNQ